MGPLPNENEFPFIGPRKPSVALFLPNDSLLLRLSSLENIHYWTLLDLTGKQKVEEKELLSVLDMDDWHKGTTSLDSSGQTHLILLSESKIAHLELSKSLKVCNVSIFEKKKVPDLKSENIIFNERNGAPVYLTTIVAK